MFVKGPFANINERIADSRLKVVDELESQRAHSTVKRMNN